MPTRPTAFKHLITTGSATATRLWVFKRYTTIQPAITTLPLVRTRSLATQQAHLTSPWVMDAVATSQLGLSISISAIEVLLATITPSGSEPITPPLISPVFLGRTLSA